MKPLRSSLFLFLVFSLSASLPAPNAQVSPGNAAPNTNLGLLSGTVRGAGRGDPIEGVSISARMPGYNTTVVTDARGRYELRLGAGFCQLIYDGPMPGSRAVRTLTIRAGEAITLDVEIPLPGSISGKVVDDTKKPLPNIVVSLVTRRYDEGELTYRSYATATTDDRGIYTIRPVPPGVPYLLVARARVAESTSGPDAGLSEDSRRSALRAAVYPSASRLTDGATLRLGPAENRRDIDLMMSRSSAYCIRGTLQVSGYSGSPVVRIRPRLPANAAPSSAAVGPGGRFSVCGLPPDEYVLFAGGPSAQDPPLVGSAVTEVVARDVDGIRVIARAATPLSGRVELAGAGPHARATIQVTLNYADSSGLTVDMGRGPLPRDLNFLGLLYSRFRVGVTGLPQGFYAKDILYGGSSILGRKADPLGPDAQLRIIVADDGGFLAVSVADRDGRPAGGSFVTIFPAGTATAPELARLAVFGVTDVSGNYKWKTLRPGKYIVLATNIEFRRDPETVMKFERAYGSGTEVEVGPKATRSVQLRQLILD